MSSIVDIAGGNRLANKVGVAQFFGVTMLTVGNWVRKGCPVVERGDQRKQWKFDLHEVARWKFTSESPDGETDPDNMTPTDRNAWYDSEKKRRFIQIQDGELIPAADVERTVGTAFAAISQDIQGLPDYIERVTGCGPAMVTELEKAIDARLSALAAALSEFTMTEAES